MWTVIYITSSRELADKVHQQLSLEGFLVKIQKSKVIQQYEILVPKTELKEVREVLTTIIS